MEAESMRAEFGGNLSCTPARIVVADPEMGCAQLRNKAEIDGNYVVVRRGQCTLVEKIADLQWAHAIGVIIVNGETMEMQQITSQGIEIADVIAIPIILVDYEQGNLLIEAAKQNYTVGVMMMVEENCKLEKMMEMLSAHSTAVLKAAREEELRPYMRGPAGTYIIKENKKLQFDYLKAEYGGEIDFDKEYESALVNERYGCKVTNQHELHEKLVVAYRGECTLLEKILALQSAGAVMVILINDQWGVTHLKKAGELPWDQIHIPVILVSEYAGKELRKQLDHNKNLVHIRFKENYEVSAFWTKLNLLVDPKYINLLLFLSREWQKDEGLRKKQYKKLSLMYHPDKPDGNVDRFEMLLYCFGNANWFYLEDKSGRQMDEFLPG